MSITNAITALQEMLRLIAGCVEGIPSLIPDGTFGSQTEACVKAFQKEAGLPVTGKVDLITWNIITEAYTSCLLHVSDPQPLMIRFPTEMVLSPGAENLYVYLAQAILLALSKKYHNLSASSVTGVYDKSTAAAVQQLQKILQLEETGIIDREVWNRLIGLYQASAPETFPS